MRARTGLLGRLDSLDTEKTTYMNTVHIIPRETSGGVKRKLWLDRLDTVKTTYIIPMKTPDGVKRKLLRENFGWTDWTL